jgi:sec-independent protein translocase protein TatC
MKKPPLLLKPYFVGIGNKIHITQTNGGYLMENEFTLVEHLSELRKRLLIVITTFVITLIIGLYFSPKLLHVLKQQEVAAHVDWNIFHYTDGIFIYLQCALIISCVFTLPVLMYQTWKFMKPGLLEKEIKQTFIFIPAAFLLFIIGVCFAYFVLFPIMLNFMKNINQSIGATEVYGMKQYFALMFGIIIPVAVIFELPIIIGFLTKIGILNSKLLKKSRKVAYFLLVVIGISITPPDFVSDFLIIVPMILLYEVSVLIAKSIERKAMKQLNRVISEE